VPALNLAICWKLYKFYTQSAGNLYFLKNIRILRDYTLRLFLLIKRSFNSGGAFIKNFVILNCFYSTYYSSNKNFEYYITGLIEGDGIIITPKTLYSEKGKKNYPSIQISFNSKDFPLVLKIQEILGFGSIKKEVGKNAYRYTINNHSGIIDMVNILNGKMRTAKIHSLNVLID
jgi:hypothetical protein